jgi:DNA-binding response OmpR family regulator
MDKPLIAVIEDEEHLAQGLIYNLAAEGYRTHHESDGETALAWLLAEHPLEESPAAILLDVMLPGRDGFSIVRALRDAGHYTPVLMLTARGRAEDIVEGFTAGADDYLAKPFDLDVLLARLTALLRRLHWPVAAKAAETPPPAPLPPYTLAGHVIDFDALEIRTPAGKDTPAGIVHLTLMECDLLRYLIEHPNKIVARKELLEKVWHVHEDTDTRAIDNFIVRLRRYLEPSPSKPVHLVAVRGVGYRFVPEP